MPQNENRIYSTAIYKLHRLDFMLRTHVCIPGLQNRGVLGGTSWYS